MSLLTFLRRLGGGPKPKDPTESDLEAMESMSGGAAAPGIASPEAVEVAEAEVDEYEAPPE